MARYLLIIVSVAMFAIVAVSSVAAQSPTQRRAQSSLCRLDIAVMPYTAPCGVLPVDLPHAVCAYVGAPEGTTCLIGLVRGGCLADRGAQRYEVTIGTDGTAEKKHVAVRAARCGPPAQAGGDPVWHQALPANWIPSGT
jgi:hypothetical protein